MVRKPVQVMVRKSYGSISTHGAVDVQLNRFFVQICLGFNVSNVDSNGAAQLVMKAVGPYQI